jgi:hypothetical protein
MQKYSIPILGTAYIALLVLIAVIFFFQPGEFLSNNTLLYMIILGAVLGPLVDLFGIKLGWWEYSLLKERGVRHYGVYWLYWIIYSTLLFFVWNYLADLELWVTTILVTVITMVLLDVPNFWIKMWRFKKWIYKPEFRFLAWLLLTVIFSLPILLVY